VYCSAVISVLEVGKIIGSLSCLAAPIYSPTVVMTRTTLGAIAHPQVRDHSAT